VSAIVRLRSQVKSGRRFSINGSISEDVALRSVLQYKIQRDSNARHAIVVKIVEPRANGARVEGNSFFVAVEVFSKHETGLVFSIAVAYGNAVDIVLSTDVPGIGPGTTLNGRGDIRGQTRLTPVAVDFVIFIVAGVRSGECIACFVQGPSEGSSGAGGHVTSSFVELSTDSVSRHSAVCNANLGVEAVQFVVGTEAAVGVVVSPKAVGPTTFESSRRSTNGKGQEGQDKTDLHFFGII